MMWIRRRGIVAGILFLLPNPVFGQPNAVSLIAPSADVSDTTVAFSWHSTPGATWYQLWLGTLSASLVMEQWYTAEHAGCASGATCSVVLTPPIGGGAVVHPRVGTVRVRCVERGEAVYDVRPTPYLGSEALTRWTSICHNGGRCLLDADPIYGSSGRKWKPVFRR